MPSLYAAPYRVGICGPAVAGLMAMVLCGLGAFQPRKAPWMGRAGACGASVGFAALCAWLTVVDNASYTSQIALFATFHRADPDNIPTTCQYSREVVAAGRAPEAAAMLERMLDRLFGNGAWREPGVAATELRDNAALQRRLRLQYGSSDPVARRLGGVLGDLAHARWHAGDRDGARTALRTALAVDRANPYANLVAARMALAEERPLRALGAARVSLAGQSERWEAHDLMVRTLFALRQWREAEAECRACLNLEPWRGETYQRLAFARLRLGDGAGAELALRQALRSADEVPVEAQHGLTEFRKAAASLPRPRPINMR